MREAPYSLMAQIERARNLFGYQLGQRMEDQVICHAYDCLNQQTDYAVLISVSEMKAKVADSIRDAVPGRILQAVEACYHL